MFKDKRIFVFGSGISGLGAAKSLVCEGARVTVYDEKKINISEEDRVFLSAGGAVLSNLLPAEDFHKEFDLVVLSPGVPINHPIANKAREDGLETIGEVELAARLAPDSKIIAITGTNGKTTTTALVADMVKKLSVTSYLGGNIGQSLSLAAHKLSGGQGLLVAEISSFQLESIKLFRPHIAAILNITPDHLDRHGSFADYASIKALVFKNQTRDDYLILNNNDPNVRGFADKAEARVCFFDGSGELSEGCFVRAGNMIMKWRNEEHTICRVDEISLLGAHNVENALAACAAAFFAGVRFAGIRAALTAFKGVEHRIEYTTTIKGVKYYNDSKATNPESAIKSLEAFADKQVVLIAGGHDKMTDITGFMRTVKKKTCALILSGHARGRFEQAARRQGVENIIAVDSFEEAVHTAYQTARAPQVVLLSPACSSYDMFNNFEERGRYFKKLAGELTSAKV